MAQVDRSRFVKRVHAGTYAGTDLTGTHWRIVQSGSHEWEVNRDGTPVFEAITLCEGRGYVSDEVAKAVAA